ncbi:MAG: hypothetical protein ABNH03_15945 [Alteromonas sp.]|uniref:hypothetical protein n=1 Tax=Alteromonas sp. TaxID=232 RepID=UPI0032D8BDD0
MGNTIRTTKMMFIAILACLSMGANASLITIGTFTGGDSGDGLDFVGNFTYAVNVFGAGGFSIDDASFTDDSVSGVSISAVNAISNWHTANYGNTQNDNNLETVMRSIRWSPRANNGSQVRDDVVTIDLGNLTVGSTYSLQLLFAETCCTRGFDLSFEGVKTVDDFSPYITQGQDLNTSETNITTVGAFIRYDFTAQDSTLNISFGGAAPFSDNNPIINGFTLESTKVSAPSTLAIFALCLFMLARMRRA